MPSTEDDDPVVREMDVVISQGMRERLYLLQYPLRPRDRALEPPVKARAKPKNALLEVEHSIMDYGKNYDNQAPAHLRLATVKSSGVALKPVTNYAVGVVEDNKLFLTPVHSIMQMRPTFQHVDDARDVEVEVDLDEEEEKEKAKTAPVVQQVGYKKKESERAMAARKNSYAYKRQQEEQELWVELNVQDVDDHECKQAFSRMTLQSEDDDKIVDPLDFAGDELTYLDTLNYLGGRELASLAMKGEGEAGGEGDAGGQGGGGQGMGGGSSNNAIDVNLPILEEKEEVVLGFLKRATVLCFRMLLDVASNIPQQAMVNYLEKHARLLRGNWVLKSSDMIVLERTKRGGGGRGGGGGGSGEGGGGEGSNSRRKEEKRFRDARDAVLLLLHRYGAVNRVQLQERLSVTPNELKRILEGVALLHASQRRWVLKLVDDFAFAQDFPDVVQRQEEAWRVRQEELEERFGDGTFDAPSCSHMRETYLQALEGEGVFLDVGGGAAAAADYDWGGGVDYYEDDDGAAAPSAAGKGKAKKQRKAKAGASAGKKGPQDDDRMDLSDNDDEEEDGGGGGGVHAAADGDNDDDAPSGASSAPAAAAAAAVALPGGVVGGSSLGAMAAMAPLEAKPSTKRAKPTGKIRPKPKARPKKK